MTEPQPGSAREIRHGGLMRCCIASIKEHDGMTEIGQIWDCAYEHQGNSNLIIADDGVWEWNRPGSRISPRPPT